jgi:hypothetical protein
VALTTDGDIIVERLNRKSDEAVAALLGPLDADQRARLTAAMRIIRTMLGDIEPAPVVLRPHRLGEIGWLIHRQGLLYNQQYGWNGEFEALIAGIYSEYERSPADPPRHLWVAGMEWRGRRLHLLHAVRGPARQRAAAHALCRAGGARAGDRQAARRAMRRLRPGGGLRAHAAMDAFHPGVGAPALCRGRAS